MNTQVTHFQSVRGLGAATACKQSLHGWSLRCPKNVTETKRDTTCKRCLKALTNERSK